MHGKHARTVHWHVYVRVAGPPADSPHPALGHPDIPRGTGSNRGKHLLSKLFSLSRVQKWTPPVMTNIQNRFSQAYDAGDIAVISYGKQWVEIYLSWGIRRLWSMAAWHYEVFLPEKTQIAKKLWVQVVYSVNSNHPWGLRYIVHIDQGIWSKWQIKTGNNVLSYRTQNKLLEKKEKKKGSKC